MNDFDFESSVEIEEGMKKVRDSFRNLYVNSERG